MMAKDEEGIEEEDGQLDDAFDDLDDPRWGHDSELGHDEELSGLDEEPSDDDSSDDSDDDDSEEEDDEEIPEDAPNPKSYKEIQRKFTQTTEELAGLKEQLLKVQEYGGPEKVKATLDFINNDPDFQKLIQDKLQGTVQRKDEDNSEDENLSPEAKKALKLVDDRIEKAVQRRLAEFEQQKITPMTAKQHEAHLNTLADQMTEKYGTEWSEQSATMQRIAEETFSQEKQLNITLEDVEDLYIASLRRDGKLQSFLKSQDRQKGERVVNKSTGRPKATQTHKPAKRPKTIIEAAIIASKKHKTAF